MKMSPRAKLLALFALFAAPIVASLVTYQFYTPSETSNYGELLPVRPATEQVFGNASGPAFRFADFAGKWVLVASDSGACAQACVDKLTAMRQVRLALGRNASRVERVFVVDDTQPPREGVAGEFPGMEVVLTPKGTTLPAAPANDRAHIYLLDPRGNVMMRFPAAADSKRMLRDLNRLLRASQMG
jgi:cytochrome oxidase Cu insertion factor (SCO1/SenC/PrrC family)